MPGQPAALELNMVSHEHKAKTKISENELRFSHAWYWILAELYSRACRFLHRGAKTMQNIALRSPGGVTVASPCFMAKCVTTFSICFLIS